MDILLLRHNAESTVGTTIEWCQSRGLGYRVELASALAAKAHPTDFGGLLIFGGDMEVWEESKYPWLKNEKEFVRKSLEQNRKIFGLCLGAQLIAEQLGAEVRPMKEWELGWFPVKLAETSEVITPLHWHSSAFDLPAGTELLASNETWAVQGFRRTTRQVGYQFHAEIDELRLAHAIAGWKAYEGKVQTTAQISSLSQQMIAPLKKWYFSQLDAWWKGRSLM